MTNDDKVRDEKLQYDINREATKISASSSCKINKYECPRGEEILSAGPSQKITNRKNRKTNKKIG